MGLKTAHELFVRELILNKGNLTSAYSKSHPGASYQSCRQLGSLLSRNVKVRMRLFELLEESGLGISDVIAKLKQLVYAKRYRENEKGERVPYVDNMELQVKGIEMVLRLYIVLFKLGVDFTPEEVEMVRESVELNQKKQDNS